MERQVKNPCGMRIVGAISVPRMAMGMNRSHLDRRSEKEAFLNNLTV